MATRKSEWLASIKPILDRDEAKKDAAALAKELGDILEVKVDASPENLDELAKEFNTQLKTMGKQPIVFSEKTLRGIVSQFTKAISEGISAGVAKVDFGAQLEELSKKREKILKAKNRANQAMKARTRMERLEGFNINTAELMPIDDDIAKEAQKLVDILYDSADKIDKAAEKYGKSSSHYTSAVMDAQEAYNKYLRMQKTFGKMPPSQLSAIPKDVRALYDKLGPDRERYEAGGGSNIPFEETFEAEKILDSFEELSDAFEDVVDNATKFDKMLKQVDAKIEEITRKARESGGVDDGILKGAKDGLKTLNEIEAAYKRLKVDKGTKLRQQNESHIKSALDFDPAKNNVGIKTFAKDYYDATASGDWVEEYRALLRYVKLYESYLTSTNKTHQNKVTAKNNPFTPLYEQLKPMAENARNMLQNIVNMGEGLPLVGMGDAGKDKTQDTSADAANAERIAEANKTAAEEAERKAQADKTSEEANRKAREEAEAKAKADAESQAKTEAEAKAKTEAADAAKKQQIEEAKVTSATEQQKVNNEASVDAAKEELDLTKQRIQALKQFDVEHRKQIKQGQQVETAAQIDSKTGAMERFTVGTKGGVTLPGSLVEDASTFGKQKPHLDTGLHTHWTNIAAPSPYVEGVTERGDLNVFKERLNYQRLEIIRAMQEALFLDFSKISKEALNKLIEDYNKLGEQIHREFASLTPAQRKEQFGDNFNEMLQQRLKDGFIQLTNQIPGFAEYVQVPMWPEVSTGDQIEDIEKSKKTSGKSLEDAFAGANDEIKELIKNYAILSRNIRHNIGDKNSFDQLDDIEERLTKVAPELLEFTSDQWNDLGEKFINEADSIEAEANAHKKNAEAIKEEVVVQEKLDKVKNGQPYSGTLYHGSQTLMDDATYDASKGKGLKNLGSGLYFTPDLEQAAKHGKNILQQDVQLDNVFTLTEEFITDIDALYKAMGKVKPADVDWKTVKSDLLNTMKLPGKAQEFAKNMREMGYQGMYSKGYGYGDPNVEQLAIYDENYQKNLSTKPYSAVVNGIQSETTAHQQNTVAIEEERKAQEKLQSVLEKTQQLTSGDGTGTGTGDASSSELAAERAKAEALQNEIEQKNSALQAANEEKQALQNDLDATRQQLEDSEHEKSLYDSAMNQLTEESHAKDREIYDLREQLANDGDAIFTAEQRANEAEERANNLERKLAESFDDDKKQGSVNTEELKTLLSSIVYNVKIVHDDNDKTANKIALDDSTLETTLTKVFANILNPQIQQNDSEQIEKHWALESTLQAVKGVLDNIHTNTTKIGTVNTSSVDTIAATALDGRLAEIKSVLESIDNKIAKGGAIITKDVIKAARTETKETPKTQTSSATDIKSLTKDYERLGKLRAQFEKDHNLETKAVLKNLAVEVETKRESLGLTTDETLALREKSKLAYEAEQRLIDAAKAQKDIDNQRKSAAQDAKQQAKDAETAWKKQVKDAQRATGVNAATSAANAGDQTVVRAIGTEGVSKDIENKAKELSDQIKTLRMLRDEIDKKGEQASAKDRDDLSKQIARVKELKTEVDGYLKIHEKYSGEGVTDLGDASNFGAVGTDQYWNNITEAIKKASTGKTTIKGLNADTGELTGTTKIAANTFAQWSATVDPLTGRLSMLRTGIKKTETIVEQITRKTKEIFTYFSGSSIIFKVFNELKKGVQYVRDIDDALVELRKVTDETAEAYDRFLKTAAKTGARLGATISDVTQATATFAKLGYDMSLASEMAEAALVYMNVGDGIENADEAASSIISTMKGFGLATSESMRIVDSFNQVGNEFSITSKGLGDALQRSAAALNAAGNTLDESIGLITAANTVINDPDSVGTAMKTLALRIRGAKTELAEAGLETENMAETTAKLQQKILALTHGDVDIMLDANTFKSTTQIIREMSEAWESMTDVERAAATELLAGQRQSNVLSALIQNFDIAEEAIEASANSAGSALKENEVWLDSISGKISQLNNATQAMWNDTLDSDVVKFFVDLATKLVKLVDAVGPLNIALVGLFAYLGKQHGIFDGLFKPAEESLDSLKKKLVNAQKDLDKATQKFNDSGSAKDLANKEAQEQRVKDLSKKVEEKSARDDVVNLTKQREDLLQKQKELDIPDISEEAKQELAKVNSELEKTNKELAEAEARLEEIDKEFKPSTISDTVEDAADAFDPKKQKNSITGKKSARTKRINKLQAEGKTFDEIQVDPKVKQYTQEIEDAQRALDEYNNTIERGDNVLNQKNETNQRVAASEKAKTTSILGAVIAEALSEGATKESIAATLKQEVANRLAGNSFVQKGLKAMVAAGAITAEAAAEAASLPIKTLLTAGVKGLTAAFMELWAVIWPVALILLAVVAVVAVAAAAIYGLVKLIDALVVTTEEAKEKLDEMKQKLSDIRAELDSVNSELETTNERIAELLAKDSLTFVEQEELDRLINARTELERYKELLEGQEKEEASRVGRQASSVVNKKRNEIGWWLNGKSEDEEVLDDIEEYRDLMQQRNSAQNLKEREKIQKKLDKKTEEIDEYIGVISEALDGVKYGDSVESDAALDYLAELQDTYAIARGSSGAKTNAIKGIFNKDEFSNTKIAIDQYVKALKDGDQSAAESIAKMIKNNYKLVKDLEARGLDAQDAIDYFTKLGDTARFDTIEGKTEEIERAKASMDDLMSGFKDGSINTDDLFDEDGKIIQTKLSEMFKGTSEKTRAELTKLLEGSYRQIADGLSDDEMQSLLSRFGLKMDLALQDVQNSVLAEQNLELFPNLKDEIDGIIDSFDEMSKALHGVVDAMDLLKQARAEEAYSGSVSLETMEKLMEHTDDYTKIMEVDEYGAIKLVDNAEEILIGTRIEKIKTDAQAALAVAEKTKQEAIAAEQDALNAKQTLEMSGPTQQWYIGIMGVLAGVIAYVASLWESVTHGNFAGMGDRASAAYESAKQSYVWDKTEGEHQRQLAEANAAYDSAVSNRENAEKELKNKELWAQYANGITPENIGSRVNADDASGGNKTKEEVADDLFQKEMTYWENRIAANQSKYEQIQNEIDLLEAKGQKADVSFYEEQIKLEGQRKSLLEQQKAEAQAFLSTLEEGSEEWWEVANTLNDIEGELDDVTSSILDLQDAIGEIDTYKFEEFNTRLDNLTSKLGTIRDLIAPNGEEDWFDDEGNWTDAGIAVAGTYLQELETYKQGYQNTMDELAKYQADYAGNEDYYETLGIHSEQEWYDKTEELISQQYDFAESISDTEQSIVDMYESSIDAVEEYVDTLIDGYNDYIDSVKEALDAERDLYDFKKNVQKQAKDIAEIERRIASLSGSTNKADIAERRKLEAQLYDSRESLNDTYYDHANDAQNEALDAEQEAYETVMTKMVENMRVSLEEATADMDAFLDSVTIAVSMNADTVLQKYQDTEVPLNDAITNPWEEAAKAVGTYGGDANDLMDVWKKDGYFAEFKSTASTNLSYPWSAGVTAANTFKNSVSTVMGDIANNIRSNVSNITSYLGSVQSAYSGIISTAQRAKAEVDSANAAAAAGVGYTGSAVTTQPT